MPDKRRDDEQLPPIPDGGLSQSMPDWLRRPPAWRTLPDTEVVQPEPASTGELPDADTSVIDPREFLSDEDLPAWLRRFGETARPVTTQAPPDDGADAAAEHARERADAAPTRFVPREPVVRTSERNQSPARRSDATSTPRRTTVPRSRAAWWQGPQLAILLAIALLVALIIIAILVI